MAGVIALMTVAAIAESGALAFVVAMFALGVLVVIFPFIVIHYDEHPELRERPKPH